MTKRKTIIVILVIVALLGIAVVYEFVYEKMNAASRAYRIDIEQNTFINLSPQNPFYGVRDQKDLEERMQLYFAKRWRERANPEQIKREVKSYLLGTKLTEMEIERLFDKAVVSKL